MSTGSNKRIKTLEGFVRRTTVPITVAADPFTSSSSDDDSKADEIVDIIGSEEDEDAPGPDDDYDYDDGFIVRDSEDEEVCENEDEDQVVEVDPRFQVRGKRRRRAPPSRYTREEIDLLLEDVPESDLEALANENSEDDEESDEDEVDEEDEEWDDEELSEEEEEFSDFNDE